MHTLYQNKKKKYAWGGHLKWLDYVLMILEQKMVFEDDIEFINEQLKKIFIFKV
jgi:hypothetical protein